MTNPANYAVLIILILLAWVVFIPWLRMMRAGASIPILELVFMSIRKAATWQVLKALGMAQKHGLEVTASQLEVHHLAGGDPLKVVEVMLKYKDRPELTFKQLSIIDLQGDDLEEALSKASGPIKLQLYKIPVGGFYVDMQAEIRSVYLLNIGSTQVSDIESMVKHTLRLAEGQLTGASYHEASEMLEHKVFGEDFWVKNGWNLIDQQIRVRKAD